MVILRPPGVYAAQGDTLLLISALRREGLAPGSRVLDVGTGSGALAVAAAQLGGSVTAVDISRRALGSAWANAALRGKRIVVRVGDLLEPVRGRLFDLVLSNPPYVPSPSPDGGLPTHGVARAWDAGPAGRALLDRLCRDVPRVLAPGGVVPLVHSSLCGIEATRSALERSRGARARSARRPAVRRRHPQSPAARGQRRRPPACRLCAYRLVDRARRPPRPRDRHRGRSGRLSSSLI